MLMAKAASGFELCTQAYTLTKLNKGVSDSVVAGNHILARRDQSDPKNGTCIGDRAHHLMAT